MAVLAGGSMPVGRHNTPASEMVHQTEAGGPGKQFRRNRAWFYPTIDKWLATHLPPQPEQDPTGAGTGAGGRGGAPEGYRDTMSPAAAALVSESGTAEHPAQAIEHVVGSGQAAALGSWGEIPGPDWDKPDQGFQGRFFAGNNEIGSDPVTGSNLLTEADYEQMAQEQADNNPVPGAPGLYLGDVKGPDMYQQGWDPVSGSNLDPVVDAPGVYLGSVPGPDMEARGWDPLTGSNLANPHSLSLSPFATLTRAAAGIRKLRTGGGSTSQPAAAFGSGPADPSSGQPDFGGFGDDI